MRRFTLALIVPLGLAALAVSCDGSGDAESLTVYSGREQELVGALIERFEAETDVEVEIRYGETAELAATILEEGSNSPADVFFAQDAGALGLLGAEGRLTPLPDRLLDDVPPTFRSRDGLWVGISGRARTVVYNTERVDPTELPDSILRFTDPRWKGKIGWAPTNASFQAFVTALRALEGDDVARQWLEGVRANEPLAYPKNTPIVQAVIDGEVDVGFVNHYYLLQFLAEDPDAPAANHFLPGGDPGGLVNVAGVGIVDTTDSREPALRFAAFLLSEESQRYFAEETYEYPLVEGVGAPAALPPLESLEHPEIDLSDLADLRGTLDLLTEVGVL